MWLSAEGQDPGAQVGGWLWEGRKLEDMEQKWAFAEER